MLRSVKNGIGATFSITIGIFSIIAVSWGLISLWTSMPKHITYEIMSVERTTEAHACDTPFVTILKDVKTKSIDYKCGKLGRIHEIKEIEDK